ncbi:hypothetical protein MXAN_1822 [Myxococcus xanthus DK 1622]|uniref:Uncharacterized protein n=2 Tax=Myxococcaceae TaxID=31 RepID=Q1DBA5_MYXXD|nr:MULTISPECIES: hypothetical protein [Myxococcus]ABF88219.1 hypothetical protein MXAN_1822 [Myxococcus xanthus DK 1622]QZZ49563.1 hypothetical protein MyxoNM_10140 [Myxococcus xanthus]UYI23997.1 hypothetical protein N1129_10040 [Myxococcus xanthus]SDY35573.1 hypothetical protein SAMN05444383_1514 [Myxococcus xanthus]
MATTSQQLMMVGQRTARHGIPQPYIEVRFPKDTRQRTLDAALHRLYADIELATPESESWDVRIEQLPDVFSFSGGRVYLELAEGTPVEAERAMALLKRLVG